MALPNDRKIRMDRRLDIQSDRRSLLDHLTLAVENIATSKAFYLRALEPVGIGVFLEFDRSVGFHFGGLPSLWLFTGGPTSPPLHIAFTATSRTTVDQFYAAALDAGGRDHGAPGLRTQYHPDYYGAFVLDPDGHNIEVVCHLP